MSDFISTYTIDFSDIKSIPDKSKYTSSKDWVDLICERGSFRTEDTLLFDYSGIEIRVKYDLYVDGRVLYDNGDYYNDPYSEVDIIDVSIDVVELYIDGYEVELTEEIKISLEKEIRKNL